jgi:hypothetical protein
MSNLNGIIFEAHRASEFTLRIKSQIIRSVMEGCCPVVVSMGTNALSHNWGRFSLFQREFEAAYRPLSIFIRISVSEAKGPQEETSRVICLETIDWHFVSGHNVDEHHRA